MAKIGTKSKKRLKKLGINAKTEEEAKKKLLAILEKEGVDGMEDESIAVILEMVEAFDNNSEPEPDDDEELDDEVDDTEAEADALAKEAEEEEKQNATQAEEEGDETEEEEDDEVDDEVEEPKPAKKATPAKKETKKSAAKKEPAKKETTTRTRRSTRLDPKNNEDDRKWFEPLKEIFPESEYAYNWVSNSGVTIKHKGNNSKRAIMAIESCTVKNDVLVGNVLLMSMSKQLEVLDEKGIAYELNWAKHPVVNGMTMDEVKEMVEQLLTNMTGMVDKLDKRLGENRKKMEESLKNSKSSKKATPAKKATKKKAVEEDDDEEE